MTEQAMLTVDFAGEIFQIAPGEIFTVGRQGTLSLDDNLYLHRTFLEIAHSHDLWWVTNIGGRLPANLTDERGLMRSTLAPGARLPLVFPTTLLTFSAGATTYEIICTVTGTTYDPQPHTRPMGDTTTIAPTTFTDSQLLCILALAEPILKRVGSGSAQVPSAVDAAARLGWTQTRFNRKLDNVCDKLDRAGVNGLRGGRGDSASNRRVALVEYAVSTLMVTQSDLRLLEIEARKNAQAVREEESLR